MRRTVFLVSERVAGLDISSGHIDWVWPESNHAGIRGMGRGVLAGSEIFWPTRNEILALDSKTGSQTRPPISLSPIVGGANLSASRGRSVGNGVLVRSSSFIELNGSR